MTRWSSDADVVLEDRSFGARGLSMNWDWQDLGTQASRPDLEAGVPVGGSEIDRELEIDEAYQRGFKEGEAAGLERALRELNPTRQAAEQAASQLTVLWEELTGRTEENVMALALVVARRILERELKSSPEMVAKLVEKALTHFPLDQKIKVRLNPADLAFLSGEGQSGPPVETSGREVRWIPDGTVSRGGCLVEGPEHVVDGRLDTALERIYRTVFDD
jgi:flagellar biosynthesis/type III secretory pathway protein FliH